MAPPLAQPTMERADAMSSAARIRFASFSFIKNLHRAATRNLERWKDCKRAFAKAQAGGAKGGPSTDDPDLRRFLGRRWGGSAVKPLHYPGCAGCVSRVATPQVTRRARLELNPWKCSRRLPPARRSAGPMRLDHQQMAWRWSSKAGRWVVKIISGASSAGNLECGGKPPHWRPGGSRVGVMCH